jgi:translation initiation factor IF-1
MNDFPIHRAIVIELIDDHSCYVDIVGIGRSLASRSSKVKRSIPILEIGLIVAVQLSPYEKTRCRITYHRFG